MQFAKLLPHLSTEMYHTNTCIIALCIRSPDTFYLVSHRISNNVIPVGSSYRNINLNTCVTFFLFVYYLCPDKIQIELIKLNSVDNYNAIRAGLTYVNLNYI